MFFVKKQYTRYIGGNSICIESHSQKIFTYRPEKANMIADWILDNAERLGRKLFDKANTQFSGTQENNSSGINS